MSLWPRALLPLLLCGILLAIFESSATARPDVPPGQQLVRLWEGTQALVRELDRGLVGLVVEVRALGAEVRSMQTDVSDLGTGLESVGRVACGDLDSCLDLVECPCFDADDLAGAESCAVVSSWNDSPGIPYSIRVHAIFFPDLNSSPHGFLEPGVGGECKGRTLDTRTAVPVAVARSCQRLIVSTLGPCATAFREDPPAP